MLPPAEATKGLPPSPQPKANTSTNHKYANKQPPRTHLALAALVIALVYFKRVESGTVIVRPSGGAATLIPGQPLHFECRNPSDPHAAFRWYKRTLSPDRRTLIDPAVDEMFELHNGRLILMKPDYQFVADYWCQQIDPTLHTEIEGELAIVRVRLPPYIEEFDVETSHTGKSTTVTEGERVELTCRVRDESAPVNLTWLRSLKADDESVMVPIYEIDTNLTQAHLQELNAANPSLGYHYTQTYTAPNVVLIEKVDNFTKRLVIESVGPEHRGYYSCMVDNGVTERARKTIFIRVKDNIVALWPFLGIMAELFILFTIIHIWETQRAQKALQAATAPPGGESAAALLQ